jgi:hypothetical protein
MLVGPPPPAIVRGMRTVLAVFTALIGLWFTAGAVWIFVRRGWWQWEGTLGAILMAIVGITTLRAAGYLLKPTADDREKLS